ncbi:hypothetical protein RHGRI_011272 [Rhododendron griersonianum]|uniref:Uncharacterized protein n=1 Tax=Rhododendron griersonianum TaxID=479676 RepID=A0AAV6KLA1_9ERIC|nr:hypothetical protein RHGRI_011272 [Rhododendron griersonianum]
MFILPFPWFFPLPKHGNKNNLTPYPNDKQNGTAVNNEWKPSSSSKTIAHVAKCHPLSPIKVKTEASPTVGRIVNALPATKQDLTEKIEDANAATEARKRRKEHTKLKTLNFRQLS